MKILVFTLFLILAAPLIAAEPSAPVPPKEPPATLEVLQLRRLVLQERREKLEVMAGNIDNAIKELDAAIAAQQPKTEAKTK